MRRILVVTALGLLAASPAAAQKPQKGTWELGAFGRYNWYDGSFNQVDSTSGQNSWGAGGRIGYFFSRKWNLELDGSYNATDINEPDGPQSVGLILPAVPPRRQLQRPVQRVGLVAHRSAYQLQQLHGLRRQAALPRRISSRGAISDLAPSPVSGSS